MNRKKIILILTAAALLTLSGLAQQPPFYNKTVYFTSNISQIVSIDDTDGIVANLNYAPKVTLCNNGTTSQIFILCFEISNLYKRERLVMLSQKASVTVLFDEIMLPQGNLNFIVKLYSPKNPIEALEVLTKSVSVTTDSLSFK